MKKRVIELDILKGFGIILVVLGHNSPPHFLNVLIYAFHMPLFFFISGYIFNGQDNIYKKFQSLIVPFYFIGLLSYLLWILKQAIFRSDEISFISPLIGLLYGSNINNYLYFNLPLWFFTALFSIYLIVYIFKHKYSLLFILSLVMINYIDIFRVIILPFSLNQALIGLSFFIMGNLFKYNNFKLQFQTKTYIVFGITILIWLYSVFFNGKVDLLSLNINIPILFFLNGLVGSILIFYLFFNLKIKLIDLSFLGQHSMIIFSTHIPLGWILKYFYLIFFNYNFMLFSVLEIIFYFFAINLYYKIREKNVYNF